MKVHLATAADEEWSRRLKGEFETLAHSDTVGAHSLVNEAEAADLILFVDPHQHMRDWAMRAFRTHPFVRRWPSKTFIYDERDEPLDLLPGVYVSLPRAGFNPRRHRACSYYYLKTNTRGVVNHEPDLLFSFQGRRAGEVRSAIFDLHHADALIEDTSGLNFFAAGNPKAVKAGQQHYREILGRSRFVLCPRGTGTSSFRLFETLACGRVPVILSDEWVAPEGVDWDSCSVRVPESRAHELAAILEKRREQWPQMSAAALRTYNEWFAPEVWFHHVVESCHALQQNAHTGPNARFWVEKGVWRGARRSLRAAVKRSLKRA
jgi:hypothetical protein